MLFPRLLPSSSCLLNISRKELLAVLSKLFSSELRRLLPCCSWCFSSLCLFVSYFQDSSITTKLYLYKNVVTFSTPLLPMFCFRHSARTLLKNARHGNACYTATVTSLCIQLKTRNRRRQSTVENRHTQCHNQGSLSPQCFFGEGSVISTWPTESHDGLTIVSILVIHRPKGFVPRRRDSNPRILAP